MKYKKLPLGIYQANCYIVYDDQTLETAVIDPGGDFELLKSHLEENHLKTKYIILTHAHADHIGALKELAEYTKAEVCIHKDDKEALENCNINLTSMMGKHKIEMVPDIIINDKDELKIGMTLLKIIHTPGHTKGSISIQCDDVLFTGDTLFAGSIGRTDLLGGSYEEIMKSINKLVLYPVNTTIQPGHGPASNIKAEKSSNPFLQ